MYSAYTILGLDENSPESEVEAVYRHLSTALDPHRFKSGSLGEIQCKQSLVALEHAYQTLINTDLRQKYQQAWKDHFKSNSAGALQPKLGQLCVASGMITLEELEHAVESQTSVDLPLGQILQEQKLITQAELDGLLLGQSLIHLPVDSAYGTGQRLLALGVVTEDMVRIALIEERTFDKSIEAILVGHDWLDPTICNILFPHATA